MPDQVLMSKPGVGPMLKQLLGWTIAFFGLPLAIFFGGRERLGFMHAAVAAVGVLQLVLFAFAYNAYRTNYPAKED